MSANVDSGKEYSQSEQGGERVDAVSERRFSPINGGLKGEVT